MSGSVNKVVLIGHLGADPETKSFANGGKVVNFRIATSEKWTDRASGERKERTEWHSIVVASEGLVSVAEKYLRKGKLVYIEGQLRTRKWQDQGGADRWSTEILLSGPGAVMQMLDSNPSGRGDYSGYAGEAAERGARDGSGAAGVTGATGAAASSDGLDDDEIPF